MIFVPHSCQRLVDCIYRGYFWAPYPTPLTCLLFYHYHTVLITAALQGRIVGSSNFAVSAHFLAPLPFLFKHRCCHERGLFLSDELSWIQGSAACKATVLPPRALFSGTFPSSSQSHGNFVGFQNEGHLSWKRSWRWLDSLTYHMETPRPRDIKLIHFPFMLHPDQHCPRELSVFVLSNMVVMWLLSTWKWLGLREPEIFILFTFKLNWSSHRWQVSITLDSADSEFWHPASGSQKV